MSATGTTGNRADGIVKKRHNKAVILHFFYPDMWDGIRSYLDNLHGDFDLYVTIPAGLKGSEDLISADYPHAQFFHCSNRGRDIGPFLVTFRAIAGLGYQIICKIHTKKTPQLGVRGIEWQQDMLDKLLGSSTLIACIQQAFDQHPDWGVIAPQGHTMPGNFFWKANEKAITRILRELSIDIPPANFEYVAGSMFWFRPAALGRVLSLDLHETDFEPERGQRDGTLAHALERVFGIVVVQDGYKIAESSKLGIRPVELSYWLQSLIQEVEDLEDSVSWRITSPLRSVAAWARKAMNRGHRSE